MLVGDFVKLMALRNLLAGVDFLIVDPENEYAGVCRAADGQFIRLASTSAHHLNPFDLPPETATASDGLDPLAEQVTAVVGLLNRKYADVNQLRTVPECNVRAEGPPPNRITPRYSID